MGSPDPQAALDKARRTFHDVLDALELDDGKQVMLMAAAESLAKARAVAAVADFTRGGGNTDPGPN